MRKLLFLIYFLLRFPFIFAVKLSLPIVKQKPAKITKILLIRTDRLGDFISSLPVVDNLALAYPEAKINILVRPYLKEFAETLENIDHVIVYDNFFKTAQQLRRQHFDLAIDLVFDYKLKTALLAFLSQASIRLGFAWGFREILFSDSVNPQSLSGKNMVSLNLALLEKIGVAIRLELPKIKIENKLKPRQAFIAMHPGGNFASQRWGRENFVKLARKLMQSYPGEIMVIGAQNEQRLVGDIVSESKDHRVKAVFLKLSELSALLSDCDVLICNNSGPLHLAAALGVATVSMMGPTNPQLWWPVGQNQLVIRKELSCSPCSKALCRQHRCMKEISVEEVERRVLEVLNKKITGINNSNDLI